MIENREIMASNIRYYMDKNKVNASDVCKALGFKQNTFSDWINAKTYPRIDKIERMARYFNIPKSFLVEGQPMVFDSADAFEREWHKNGGGEHSIILSPIERDLIYAFRCADKVTQDNICKILDVKKDLPSSKEA